MAEVKKFKQIVLSTKLLKRLEKKKRKDKNGRKESWEKLIIRLVFRK